jgi:hypothetical protein
MAKEELKQMTNKVTIQGVLVDNHMSIKVDNKGRRYLSGAVEVKVDNDYIIPVDTFAYELKSNGEKSAVYDRLAKVIDWPSARTVGANSAPRVTITNARIEDNSFYSEKDDRIVNNWRIGGAFFRTAANDAKGINEFEVEGIISSIKEVLDRNGESTNTYQIKLLNVGFGEKVNEITFTYDDPEAIKYINDNYNVGDKVTLCGQVVYTQTERTVKKELGFGEPVTETYTNTVRLLKITAGTEPMSPEESGIALKDLQTILVKQNNIIKEKAEAKSQAGAAKTPATSVNNLLF